MEGGRCRPSAKMCAARCIERRRRCGQPCTPPTPIASRCPLTLTHERLASAGMPRAPCWRSDRGVEGEVELGIALSLSLGATHTGRCFFWNPSLSLSPSLTAPLVGRSCSTHLLGHAAARDGLSPAEHRGGLIGWKKTMLWSSVRRVCNSLSCGDELQAVRMGRSNVKCRSDRNPAFTRGVERRRPAIRDREKKTIGVQGASAAPRCVEEKRATKNTVRRSRKKRLWQGHSPMPGGR